jgi:hypothetical protein
MSKQIAAGITIRFSTFADWILSNPAHRSRTHAVRSAEWTGVGAHRYLTTACGKRFLGLEVDAGDGAVLRDGSSPTCEVCQQAIGKGRRVRGECRGHQPGPNNTMGETVYCDGSCRALDRRLVGSR